MNGLTMHMPEMAAGRELEEAMLSLPSYDPGICHAGAGARLSALNDIADIYVPSQMSHEIYSKIYLAMLHSLKKKQTAETVKQGNQNHRRLQGLDCNSVLGGADSFSITGPSGIGKSTAIAKSIALSGGGGIIQTENPYARIIPCVNVQCPHDCSVKGLLLAVLSQVDMAAGTGYAQLAVKNRASVDSLIGTVSQVALNSILLIVIDECQNICRSRNGANLVASMTQLINSSGVSVCMVGLPETEDFFRQEMQLARRSVGLAYTRLPYGDYFIRLCGTLFSYQYVAHPSEPTPDITELLYECTGGITAVAVSVIMEAQQIAILTGREELSREMILKAYQERYKNMHGFVRDRTGKRGQTSAAGRGTLHIPDEPLAAEAYTDTVFAETAGMAKERESDLLEMIRGQGITVEEETV